MIRHLGRKATKALANSGKSQMEVAVECKIGLSTLRRVLEGNPPKDPDKLRRIENWVNKNLNEEGS